MAGRIGGRRPGAGRPVGSKNRTTLARAAVAEVLDVRDADRISQEVHKRGHQLLLELERITLDPTQPIAARIMAAKVTLPFLLPKTVSPVEGSTDDQDRILRAIYSGRRRLLSLKSG